MSLRFATVVTSLLMLTSASFAGPGADRSRAPMRMPDPVPSTAKANNDFAWQLYDRIRNKGDDNVLFSPFSITTAMSMVWAGADGETAKQMANVLGATMAGEQFRHWGMARIAQRLAASKGVKLNLANKAWAQKGFTFEPAFMNLIKTNYRTELGEHDFAKDAASAHKIINKWVAKQTNDKIPQLFGPKDIIKRTRMVLANAIYFKGDWKLKFDEKLTQKKDFWVKGNKAEKVDMMSGTRRGLRYEKRNGYAVLEIPYKGGQQSMVIALPDDKAGLSGIEKRLKTEGLMARRWARQVIVNLPKFKFDAAMGLGDHLAKMGMPRAFQPFKAEFGRMADKALYIHKVVHKAFIEVNEKGTEVAAATGVVVASPTSAGPPPKPVVFNVDRPFVFGIRDVQTNTLVFLGRVTDPR